MAHIVKMQGNTERPYEVRWSWYEADGARHFKKQRFRTDREAKAKKRQVEDAVAAQSLPDYAGGKESVAAWGDRRLASKGAKLKPPPGESTSASGGPASSRPGAHDACAASPQPTCRTG